MAEHMRTLCFGEGDVLCVGFRSASHYELIASHLAHVHELHSGCVVRYSDGLIVCIDKDQVAHARLMARVAAIAHEMTEHERSTGYRSNTQHGANTGNGTLLDVPIPHGPVVRMTFDTPYARAYFEAYMRVLYECWD